MNLTLTRPLVILDVETTGTSLVLDRIIQIAFRRHDPATPDAVETYGSRLNPGRSIPPEATAIHGITDADVADQPSFAALADPLYQKLAHADVAGYRVKFDIGMVNAAFARERMPQPFGPETQILDAARLWQILEPRTLKDAVARFAPDTVFGAHDAAEDIRATEAVLRGQLLEGRLFSPALPQTVAELHALQWPWPDGALDPDGKVIWRDGAARWTFGKYEGQALTTTPEDYFTKFILKDTSAFSPEVQAIARQVLRREPLGPRI